MMTSTRLLRSRLIFVGLAISMVIAGCGGEQSEESTTTEAEVTTTGGDAGTTAPGSTQQDCEWQVGEPWDACASPEWADVLQAARDEGTVVIGGPAFLGEPMATAFEADTGIQLEWIGASGSELSARMPQEVAAGAVTMDGKFGGAQELFVDWESILSPLADQLLLPGVTDPSVWHTDGIDWYDPAESYMLKGSRWVFGWPVVNADVLDPASIGTWSDLLDPQYVGMIGSHEVSTPSPGQGTAHFIYNTKGQDFLEDLYLGQEVTFTPDFNQVVEWAARDTYPIVLGAVQSVLERFRSEGFNLEPLLLEDEQGYITSGFSVFVMPNEPAHPNAAQVFLNWYASQPGSTVYSSVMLEASNRTDVDPESIPDYTKPQSGVEYWEDSDLEWFLNERGPVSEMLAEWQEGGGS
jgi:ABC-type Fe3+ transport system substrate-binding protein